MRKSWYIRFLSMALCVVLVAQMVPVRAIVMDAADVPTSAAVDIAESHGKPDILEEVDSLRTETEKHFRLTDGSYIAVNYGLPVHYLDGSGSWQDIDNTLSLVTDRNGVNAFRTGNAAVPAFFSQNLQNGDILTSTMDGVSVSMSLLDTSRAMQMIQTVREELAAIPEETVPVETETIPTEGVDISEEETVPLEADASEEEEMTSTMPVETAPGELETLPSEERIAGVSYNRDSVANVERDTAPVLDIPEENGWTAEEVLPEKLHSSIRYEDVFPGVDLLYTAYSHNIKEQILVKSAQEGYRYDFLLKTQGLTAVLNEDGSVSLTNGDGVTRYSIPAPYMEDGDGHISDHVTYTLTETAQGYILTVEADAQWINEADRAFPVAIDPSLVVEVRRNATDSSSDIHATYVIQGTPTTTQSDYQELYCGYVSYLSQKLHRVYMYFQNLPSIPEGAAVTNAELNLYMKEYSNDGRNSLDLGLYEVTGENTRSDGSYYKWLYYMNWNNQPTYDTANMLDYNTVSASTTGRYLAWDMTELVKKWYMEGTENRTVAMAMPAESGFASQNCAAAKFYAYGPTKSPVLIVSYRNNVGLEPYYTYSTVGAGAAGAGYIADGSGQLKVLNTVLGFASTINPFALNLVYNSDYFASSTSDYLPMEKMGLAMQCGSGWTLDVAQKVIAQEISGVPYLRYHDGDGTVHYFAKDPSRDKNYYYDEDGLGLKIQDKGGNAYVMSDDRGNTWTFTGNYLSAMSDANGNQYQIVSGGGRITAIVQKNKGGSAITVAALTYSGNNLSAIQDYAGNKYTFTYTEGKLTAISMNGKRLAEYGYTGRRLNLMTDTESGYSVAFTYANGRVSRYREQVGTAAGAEVGITYPNYSETVYRDFGADRTANTADDLITRYQFDYAGRTANVYTTDNTGNILGASNAAYSGSGSTDRTNNRTLRTASIGAAAQHCLINGDFERNTEHRWTVVSGMAVTTANPRTGACSLQGTASAGSIYAAKNSESLTAGVDYALSAYVNTAAMTGFTGKGIYLKIQDPSGKVVTSEAVNYKTDAAIDDGWVRLSVAFTAKTSGAHTVHVYCENAAGTFYVDDLQLEKAKAPSNRNMLENGDMNINEYFWTKVGGAAFAAGGQSGMGMRIPGAPGVSAYAYQDAAVNLPGTQTYVLSGWVKANSVPSRGSDTERTCGLRATVIYADNTTENHYAPFNADLPGWQFTSLAVVPKQPAKTVKTIRVACVYEKNANVAIFDNISLVREAAQTMKYDADGNLVSVSSPGLKQDTNTYQNGNLIQTVTGGNGTFTYTYDTTNTHRLTAVTNGVVTQTMVYDGMGNVTGTKLSGSSGGRSLQTKAVYDSTGNLLTKVTDSSGNAALFAYSTALSKMLGMTTSVTDPNGVTTTSAYDEFGRITQNALADIVELGYTYDNGLLESLTRTAEGTSQSYRFTYDEFGSRKRISVGDKVLAEYSYAPRNGYLTKLTYRGGTSVSYTYDILGRVTKESWSTGRNLYYQYNGEGQLYGMADDMGTVDTADNTYYNYVYDTLGRLISCSLTRGGTVAIRTSLRYDDCGRVCGQSWQTGDQVYAEKYTYNAKDGTLSAMKTSAGNTLRMTYDALSRLSTVTTDGYTKTYTYRDISDTQTTAQVEKLTYAGVRTGPFTYSYDKNGNIQSETHDGVTTTYTYDEQNQLLTATDGTNSYTYTYDAAGNILTASNGSETHTYTYGHSEWKDLLTAYDGHAFTFNAAANPVSYYNGTAFTLGWDEATRLTSVSGGGSRSTYGYDGNGMRMRKTADGVTHQYTYASGKLLREVLVENGSKTILDFCYDEAGTPFALNITQNGVTATYYYATNLQGDVVRIVNADRTATVATYTYDPYGKVLTAEGVLAELNPLRYRGYYYDHETGFYYLQSRYYDPAIGRFISADSFAATGQGFTGCNMFAYCGNNPINCSDPSGHALILLNNLVEFLCYDGGGSGCRNQYSGGGVSLQEDPPERNRRVLLVNGQALLPYANEHIGLGTYGENGCAVIATYNAMALIGKPQEMNHVRDEYVGIYGVLMGGLWGVAPHQIAAYLAGHGVSFTGHGSLSSLEKTVSEGDVIIFTVENTGSIFGGFHTMAAKYSNGSYTVYNTDNNSWETQVVLSLTEVYTGGQWTYGFCINVDS